ncbi:MFS transporter, partial [Candidatus Roizmanbacteria bacterium]|nr:MFS transporter [Candidatus Roizmanbacteria bacterium]
YLRRKKEQKTEFNQNSIKGVKFRDLLKNKKFILATITSFLDNISSASLFIFLPFLLLEKKIDASFLGAFTSVYFIGNLLGKSVIGRLADRFGNVKVFIVAELLMALFIFLLTGVSSIILIVIFSVILGVLTKGTIPARSSMGIEAAEHHGRYEKATAFMGFVTSIGLLIAPALYGRIADLFGIVYTFYTAALFALLAIIPALLFYFVKQPDTIFD